jgi:hypothetical protein
MLGGEPVLRGENGPELAGACPTFRRPAAVQQPRAPHRGRHDILLSTDLSPGDTERLTLMRWCRAGRVCDGRFERHD